MEHSHSELQDYFYDDGSAGSRCGLQLDENAWLQRLVDCLTKLTYAYLQGWEVHFHRMKTDAKDCDELQQQISGVVLDNATNAYVFHGAHDIFLLYQSTAAALVIDMNNIPRTSENSRHILGSCQIGGF